jgi:L-fuculose-phosphate aldolase
VTEVGLREQICEIGRRLYERGLASGSDGNISALLDQERILCTPTMVSKGFLRPDDLCIVDHSGRQISGARKRTSEILLHLAIYKCRADVGAVVHSHAPHASAFAVAGEPFPEWVLPEAEIFLGKVPTAPYHTPGTHEFASAVEPLAATSNTILLANHGVVTFAPSLENAYFNTETLDSCCRILILARQLGGWQRLSTEQARQLLDAKKKRYGFNDSRRGE